MLHLVATKAVTAGLATVVTFGLGIAPWKIGKYVDPENEKHQKGNDSDEIKKLQLYLRLPETSCTNLHL